MNNTSKKLKYFNKKFAKSKKLCTFALAFGSVAQLD